MGMAVAELVTETSMSAFIGEGLMAPSWVEMKGPRWGWSEPLKPISVSRALTVDDDDE